jgi:hypothetical protein
VYINTDRQIVVAKKTGDNISKYILFTVEMPPEERWHFCPTIGVDKKGYIHVTGDMHNASWKYYVSKYPGDVASGFNRRTDLPGIQITYPTIFYDNNRELFVCFRHASNTSGKGNHRGGIIRYNADTDVFTMLGGISYEDISGNPVKTPPAGATPTKTMVWGNGTGGSNGWYQTPGIRIHFDHTNRMHLIAAVINIHIDTTHDSHTHIIYAYSDDLGNTWHKVNGDPIMSLPLTVTNASVVIDRTSTHDIFGHQCELGAFDPEHPIVTFRLSSNFSTHSVMYDGSKWVTLLPPRSTNLMMSRANGYTAWYNGTYIDCSADGKNWKTITGETTFPGGVYADQSAIFDREYFKETGNIRYHGKFSNYTVSKIFTIYSEIGNDPNVIDDVRAYSLKDIADENFTLYDLSGLKITKVQGVSLSSNGLKEKGVSVGIYFAVPDKPTRKLNIKAIKVIVI